MAVPFFTDDMAGAADALNEMVKTIIRQFLFTIDFPQSIGLKLVITGGEYKGNTVADFTVDPLTASTTTYVEADATTGALSSNTSAYTTGGTKVKVGRAVTNTEGITGWTQDFDRTTIATP